MHGVVTVLKLFTLYETHVGNDYWLDFIRNKFRRPEIQRMASVFGMFELNVHAPFYNKINEVLNLNTEEFYNSYVKDKTLRGRMDWLDRQFEGDDMLASLAVGSIVEGAVLYSNFAFLKHFQAEGKNKLVNMAAGINFSVRDENLHSLAGAWLFNTLREESEQLDNKELDKKIYKTCGKIYEHEARIIDMIFEKGEIKGITDLQMKNFIQARLNLCLEQLRLAPLYEVDYDPISKWFYKNINTPQLHDFFHKQGNSYNRDWQETRFAW
jgi:ribonucleotide reductase beta subunit family protein with ferritin-like domain